MSRTTREINKISMAVISVSAKIIFYLLVLILLVTGARGGYKLGHSVFFSPGLEASPGTDIEISLTGEESVSEVGRILKQAGLIRDDVAFSIQAFCYEYDVLPGTFLLNTSMSSKEIILDLRDADEEEQD